MARARLTPRAAVTLAVIAAIAAASAAALLPSQPGAGVAPRVSAPSAPAAGASPTRAAASQNAGTFAQDSLDRALRAELQRQHFTGRTGSAISARLGRRIDPRLAELGRLLFFDTITGLHDDNACAGCHAPAAGFGDTQSIAIGVQNNGLVGPGRAGPRNQRRTPTVVNTAFFPSLMWNGRFKSTAGDPFSNAQGFEFPAPEGRTAFPANDPTITHLLIAQAHIPPTELVEVAGFTGVGDLGERFLQFDDGKGSVVPGADASGFRNEPIRQAVLRRLNDSSAYRRLFAASFPAVAAGAPIDFSMFGRAIAEFEFTLVRADAPLDEFARGDRYAMGAREKRGALIFFGKGHCVACHAVGGAANEMFSDFRMHNIAVPQIAPAFGIGAGNLVFDGPGEDEDFGLAQLTGQQADRYKFRSSPLRNVALQPAFFHNGAFTRLEDAIRHHLDVAQSARFYDAGRAGVSRDLRNRRGPIGPALATLDPLLREPIDLGDREFDDLVGFVRYGLLDPNARPAQLCRMIPRDLPSGRKPLRFQGC